MFLDRKRAAVRTDETVKRTGGPTNSRRRHVARRGLLAVAAALASTAAAAPAAQADLLSGVAVSSSSTQAGAYADLRTVFTVVDQPYNPVEQLRFHLPVGLLGTIGNFDECLPADFYKLPPTCAPETQVGAATLRLNFGTRDAPFYAALPSSVYVLRPGRGDTALLGLSAPLGVQAKALIRIKVRPDDYGLDATLEGIPNNVGGSDLTLWGVPWDHWDAATKARTKRLSFMANPATCGAESMTTVEAKGYKDPDRWETYSATMPPQAGCDKLPFKPEISVRADTPFTSSPSGFSFGIDVPQNTNPDKLATAPIKDVTAVLPEGVSINPSVANGLEACTDAQLGQGSNERSSCPPASRVGTAKFEVPALKDPNVNGTVYIGEPLPGDTYRLFVEAYGSSMRVKLKGSVRPDPKTGRLTVVFEDNPQAPVSSVELAFRGGPRAALAMPDTCGRKPVAAEFVSWAGDASNRLTALTSTWFDVTLNAHGTPCPPQGFAPAFRAGVSNPAAGASSPFALHVAKADGQADLTSVNLKMPKGLLANLKGNLGSRIGTATVRTGVGSQPYTLSGPVVLEGAYGDAPFSLRITVPVIAGPFNLGNVVVRQKLYVHPDTAQVSTVSDPLPTIWEGIPVKIQDIQVRIDKAGFMVNPTSCDVQHVQGGLSAVTGQTVSRSSRFQVGDCASLPYKPDLDLSVEGELKNGGHPQLNATLTTEKGEANQKKAQVTLPLNLALDPQNAKALCEPSQVPTSSCPADSIVGKAAAVSVLDVPLTGPVYFVRGERKTKTGRVVGTLPKLFIPLKGQGVRINVHASSDVVDDKLQTTFDDLPDAPIERFDLSINGGDNGILKVTNGDVCKTSKTPKVGVRMTGQNGKVHRTNTTLGSSCRFGIAKTSRNGNRIKVTLAGLTGGKITVSGKGIRKNHRTVSSRSTVASVGVSLSAASRRSLDQGRTLRIKVKTSFNPSEKGEKTVSKTKTVVVKPAKR